MKRTYYFCTARKNIARDFNISQKKCEVWELVFDLVKNYYNNDSNRNMRLILTDHVGNVSKLAHFSYSLQFG